MLSKSVQKRLAHEVSVALAARDKRGQSKHAAKQAARKAAQDQHTHYTTITGLYATSSYTTYRAQAMTALRWIADRYGCRNTAECRAYLPAYYADMQARGLSAWTIRTRVYAMCGVYGQDYATLFGVARLPVRHRADITRGRTLSATDAHYHTPAQEDVRTIARACGARRGGIMGLTASDLIEQGGQWYVRLREKGGKEREALVLPAYADAVRDIFARYGEGQGAETGGKKRLFARAAIPQGMPLHYLRAQYAQDLYRYYEAQGGAATGQLYRCRAELAGKVYDKGILMAVSRNMGHSRCDVVVSHYLYD